MFAQESLNLSTSGRGTYELTDAIERIVRSARMERGLCSLFLHHTSASLILCENADADVRSDLERFFARWVPDGDPLFHHTLEGPDDMPAHIRSIVTGASLQVPISGGRLDLGTWQGIFLWEHRTSPHRRRLTVSLVGEPAGS
jgi:secondary thiamine-phosphate synthase enzyme